MMAGRRRQSGNRRSPARRPVKKAEKPKDRFTAKQGQYLAYLLTEVWNVSP